MFDKINKALLERRFLQYTIKKIDEKLAYLALKGMSSRNKNKTDPDKIIFLAFRGGFDCNPKWICKELAKQNKGYKLIWAYKKAAITGEEEYPENVELVHWGSSDFYHHLTTAKVIIDNGISTAHQKYKRNKNQILIETWHGSIGIKKFTPRDVNDPVWVKKAFKEAKMTDYIISNSDFEDSVYREDYWKKTEIWKLGHARNDVLFYEKTNPKEYKRIKEGIYYKYKLAPDTKICLYAPTFREGNDLSQYRLPYDELIGALEQRFGGKWVIFTRFHWRILKLLSLIKIPETVIDASMYPDIQELAAVAECGITDYSSWITEYLHTKRPGFMFATDIKEYEKENRSLFFPLTDLPFPTAESGKELILQILNFGQDKFEKKWNEFMSDKGCVDDGQAAERIVNKINELLEKQADRYL